MTQQDFSSLAENLGRLYFEGEATSEDLYGYMQGAYSTEWKKNKYRESWMIYCQQNVRAKMLVEVQKKE